MKTFFDPTLITDPRLRTTGTGEVIPPLEPPMPVAPPIPPAPVKPVFVPTPIMPTVPPTPPKRKGMISIEASRRAQGIYPKEAQEKQSMIENAKAPPTPTGAWGAPK